jgi:arylsulfatase A-like enzyme
MIKETRTVKIPCSTSDYFPTVLEALGHTLPEAEARPYDGVSLLPLIRNEMKERSRPIAFESKKQISLTGNQFKLISMDAGKSYELYDLIADPGESKNLARDLPDQVSKMRAHLVKWRKSCKRSASGDDY